MLQEYHYILLFLFVVFRDTLVTRRDILVMHSVFKIKISKLVWKRKMGHIMNFKFVPMNLEYANEKGETHEPN